MPTYSDLCWGCGQELEDVDYACDYCGLEQPGADPMVMARIRAQQALLGLRIHLSWVDKEGEENAEITPGLESACLQILLAAHALRPNPINSAS